MLDDQEFVVQLVVTSTHEYVVDARTRDEALAYAEGMLEDKEYGTVLGYEVEMADVFASDEIELDEEEGD